jgi:hypothetical protein
MEEQMRTVFWICLALGLMPSIASLPAAAQEIEERIAASREVVQAFSKQLREQLMQAIQTGGAVEAIAVCHTAAPEIARVHSEAHGWSVGRTSLKPRNPANAPDAWETGVLQQFEQRKAAGEAAVALEFAEVVATESGQVFRYMKAIPTAEPCLACHGSNLAPEVAARLHDLYPQDQATGFAVGDLRGAFTIAQPM